MGLVNAVVPAAELRAEVEALVRELLAKSPTALKLAKLSFNADTDHIHGIGGLGFSALDLYYEHRRGEGRHARVPREAAARSSASTSSDRRWRAIFARRREPAASAVDGDEDVAVFDLDRVGAHLAARILEVDAGPDVVAPLVPRTGDGRPSSSPSPSGPP